MTSKHLIKRVQFPKKLQKLEYFSTIFHRISDFFASKSFIKSTLLLKNFLNSLNIAIFVTNVVKIR